MRIREAQKYADPMESDPDADPDPEHWCIEICQPVVARIYAVGEKY
jgi:hypothetical protein